MSSHKKFQKRRDATGRKQERLSKQTNVLVETETQRSKKSKSCAMSNEEEEGT